MPSPSQKARSSTASLGRSSSAGAALKRGDMKISDPIPIPRVSDDAFDSTYANGKLDYASTTLYNQLDGTWPRKIASTAPHVRAWSNGATISAKQDDMNLSKSRTSMGPSISLSSAPSKGSLSKRKNSGFRLMIRRMFGSKRHRETLSPAPDMRAQSVSHLSSLGTVRFTSFLYSTSLRSLALVLLENALHSLFSQTLIAREIRISDL